MKMKLFLYFKLFFISLIYYKILCLNELFLEIVNNSSNSVEIKYLDIQLDSYHSLGILYPQTNEIIVTYTGHIFHFKSIENPSIHFSYAKMRGNESLIILDDPSSGLTLAKRKFKFPSPVQPPVKKRSEIYRYNKFENYIPTKSEQLKFQVINKASNPIYIYWINLVNDTQYYSGGEVIESNLSVSYFSFEGHQFYITTTHPDASSFDCQDPFEHNPYDESILLYTVGSFDETVIITDGSYHEQLPDSIQMIIESQYNEFEEKLIEALLICDYLTTDQTIRSDLTEENKLCFNEFLFHDIDDLLSERRLLFEMRDLMTSNLRNYTCADVNLKTSPPLSINQETIYDGNFEVQTLFQVEEAQIFLIPNFVTSTECNILIENTREKLQRATVFGENGMATFSESRKAQQAGYYITNKTDPLWDLYSRILNFTNSHTNYQLQFEGQEPLTVIQYNPNDEYLPHCDGDCDGSIHRATGRVATAVLYCKIPELGGGTSFTKADIFIRPEQYSATFFTYMGPNGRLDNGYTEHSGCPVISGEKWIATAWMREGVSKEYPHDFYDPSGYRNGVSNTVSDSV